MLIDTKKFVNHSLKSCMIVISVQDKNFILDYDYSMNIILSIRSLSCDKVELSYFQFNENEVKFSGNCFDYMYNDFLGRVMKTDSKAEQISLRPTEQLINFKKLIERLVTTDDYQLSNDDLCLFLLSLSYCLVELVERHRLKRNLPHYERMLKYIEDVKLLLIKNS